MVRRVAIVLLAGLVSVTMISTAGSAPRDRDVTLARLDDRISDLRRDLVTGPRMGAVERSEIRTDLRRLRSAREQVAAGRSLADEQLAALMDSRRPGADAVSGAVERRLETRREVLDRRLAAGTPKLGALERARLRQEVSELDSLIADLERGEQIDLARVDRLIGLMRLADSRTAAEELRALETERTIKARRLGPGPRIGAMERSRLRDEIETLDAMIEELESSL